MKKTFLFISLMFLAGATFAQTLSWRIANPRILKQNSTGSNLEFDVQVKCSIPGTYLWAATIKFDFNSTTFNTTAGNWGAVAVGAFSGQNTDGAGKYILSRTINGSPLRFNLILSGDPNVVGNGGNPDDFGELTTDYTTICTVKARLISNTTDALAGLDFYEGGMNGSTDQQYITTTQVNYAAPCLYDDRNLTNAYTGRIYSTLHGWTSLGGTTNGLNYNNWATNYNTTVWEDAAITQTNNAAALSNNLYIGNGSSITPTLTIPSNKWLTVAGTLTNTGTAANLVVGSGGSLIHNSDNVPATIQRDITGSSDLTIMKYHFVSVPLLQSENPVSGLFLDSYLFDFTESTNQWHALGTPTTTPLFSNRGYMVYYPGAAKTYTFAGKMNNGSFGVPVTKSGSGFNLVPNPYPSAIDWDATTGWTKTNIDGAIYIWPALETGATQTNYASYVGSVETNGGSRYIAAGQSFFVSATTASPVFSMNNSVRVHNTVSFLKDSEAIPDVLRISCFAGNATDEMVVRFTAGATAGFDSNLDAYKIQGGTDAPQLNSVASDNAKLCINSLPLNPAVEVVPLNFSFNAATSVTFTASGMETFPVTLPIFLEDGVAGKIINLREAPVYTFDYEPASDVNRFKLHFLDVTGIEKNKTEIKGTAYISGRQLYMEVPAMQGQRTEVGVYNALGQKISSNRITMNGKSAVPFTLPSGVYIVRVTSPGQVFVTKIVNK